MSSILSVVMMNVIMPSVVMLSVVMLGVIMLSVVMLNVIMLSVVVPLIQPFPFQLIFPNRGSNYKTFYTRLNLVQH